MTYEINSLKKFGDLARAYVPEIYYSSEEMSLMVMKHLKEHIIMRKGMIQGCVYPEFAEHISTYLAETLFKTSSLYLSSTEKRQLK